MIKVDGNFVDVAWLERRAELEDEAAVMWRRLASYGPLGFYVVGSRTSLHVRLKELADECERKAVEARAQIERMT